MPADQFEGFAPQFAAVRVVKPRAAADLPPADIHQGNLKVFKTNSTNDSSKVYSALPTLDHVSHTRLANTSSADRHYLVATRGVVSAFLPVNPATDAGKRCKNLRRLCQHTPAEKIYNKENEEEEYAWYQVQVAAANFEVV